MICLELEIPPLPQLITVGHSFWQPGMMHFKRSFNVFDLLYIPSGSIYMAEEGREYEIGDGKVLILEPGLTHWGYEPTSVQTELYWVHFAHAGSTRQLPKEDIPWSYILPRATVEDLGPYKRHMYLPKFASVPEGTLQPILDQMVELHRTSTVQTSLLLHSLFVSLLVQLQLLLEKQVVSRQEALSTKVSAYLHSHWKEPYNAAHMEEQLHYEADYLSRCLKKVTGMSPLQYHRHIRLMKAQELLEKTNEPIKDIAEVCGFMGSTYFIRLFKQHTGVTPAKYRTEKQRFV